MVGVGGRLRFRRASHLWSLSAAPLDAAASGRRGCRGRALRLGLGLGLGLGVATRWLFRGGGFDDVEREGAVEGTCEGASSAVCALEDPVLGLGLGLGLRLGLG